MHNASIIRDIIDIVETHYPLQCDRFCECGRLESEHVLRIWAHGNFCPGSTNQQFSPLRGTPPRTWTSSGEEGRETNLLLGGEAKAFPGSTVEGEIICDACQGYRTVQAEWSEQAGRPCEKCKGKGTL